MSWKNHSSVTEESRFSQHEIRDRQPLLDAEGKLRTDGFSRHNLIQYNKEAIQKHKWRLKEWDYYQISDGHYMLQLNLFNISLASVLSAELCDLKTGTIVSDFALEPLTIGKNPLSMSADGPS